jgi:hypothetical protein
MDGKVSMTCDSKPQQHRALARISGQAGTAGRHATTEQVWDEVSKASFAVISYLTPSGEPRSCGVVYGTAGRSLYVVIAPDSWKARHIKDGDRVAVTVPVRVGGLLSFLFPIPPATVSLKARVVVHPIGSLDLRSVSQKLASLQPEENPAGIVLELVPEGLFLTYGVGVSLADLSKPTVAQAHVPVA